MKNAQQRFEDQGTLLFKDIELPLTRDEWQR